MNLKEKGFKSIKQDIEELKVVNDRENLSYWEGSVGAKLTLLDNFGLITPNEWNRKAKLINRLVEEARKRISESEGN